MIEKIVLGGGCFWCTEAVFLQLKGVVSATPGYTGGVLPHPTYERVSDGNTGHVEVIEIIYNEEEITIEAILEVFFMSHDPTTLNRQGNDIGTQYRSVIFYTTESQKEKAEHYIHVLQDRYSAQITTTVEPLQAFYEAEDYHKNYFETHKDAPYCELIIAPKVEKVATQFPLLIKE